MTAALIDPPILVSPNNTTSAAQVPTFKWMPPSLAGDFTQSLWVGSSNSTCGSCVPATQTSALFNSNGRARSATLASGSYEWGLEIADLFGNRIGRRASFTVP